MPGPVSGSGNFFKLRYSLIMMGLDSLGLGNTGSMGKSIMSIIGIGISAIILLTFAPNISGSVSGISLTGKDGGYCQLKGEAMERVVVKESTDKNANEAWQARGDAKIIVENDSDTCVTRSGVVNTSIAVTGAVADTERTTSGDSYYSPQGEELASTLTITKGGTAWTVGAVSCAAAASATAGTCVETLTGGEWEDQSESLQAGGLGTLISLLFGVMGLLIPAGALGYLGNVGTQLVSDKLGGGMGTSILVVVVSVVVIGAILPQIIEPMDTFFLAMDGNRYYIFDVGLGKIAGTISNFFGIALIAGLISLGMMMWKGRSSGGSGSYA